MRKISLLFSTMVLAALLLVACGGGATSTNVVESPPPVTVDATDDMSGTATESPTEEPMTTETPGVPVTGDVNPARLSNQLDFTVWSQEGEQIGDVEDMVLDLDNTSVAYVVVGTGGFLEIGEREVLVPWALLDLQTGTGDTTGGQQNAFILQTDVDTFSNAPDVDLATNLPQAGQPAADDWDLDIRNYWEGGGTGETEATPAAEGTADPNATATTTGEGDAATTGEPIEVTATAGTVENTGDGQAHALQGVMLASDVLGATVTLGGPDQGTGEQPATEAPEATAAPEMTATTAGTTDDATATEDTDLGTDVDDITVTIDDVIVDTDAGELLYIVVNSTFDDGERWIPIPFSIFQWNTAEESFVLNAGADTLQNAPSFQVDQFPDTTTAGWNTEFDTFWQNSGAGAGTVSGDEAGADATATP